MQSVDPKPRLLDSFLDYLKVERGRLLLRPDCLPLKLDDFAEVADDEWPVVAAGVDVGIVGDAARSQQLV